ncbi:MAG: AmmeMemoRadiSam system protein A [Candidatus Tectomicrobia bacterium]|nr:AmmeMemoRadiSam system protein A [Candidatus Tectomicrobia bacterium]
MDNSSTLHPWAELAKQAMTRYLMTGEVLAPSETDITRDERRAGVFVSLKKKGSLRGCIGTLLPTQPTLAEEIVRNAISAATSDPRFLPITIDELESLDISIDVLSPPFPVDDRQELDPKRYGVIVINGRRRGVLLPDIAGVNTVEEQVEIARQKAGIAPYEKIKIMRFEVQRYM